jgi:hypothetical protein
MSRNLAAGRWKLHTTHAQWTAVGSGELQLGRQGVFAATRLSSWTLMSGRL